MFFFLLVFLLPFLPDDLACFAAGLTAIPIPALMLTSLAGRLPGIWVSCWVGAHAASLSPMQWAMVATFAAALAALFLVHGEAWQQKMLSWVECLTRR
jgi:uncharacterized membrane protein YdjX (TVP38/TMEM64 family)